MARLALLVTGASGMRLPLHVLDRLTAEKEVERLHLVVSAGARKVLEHEAHELPGPAASLLAVADLDRRQAEKVVEESNEDLASSIASGSNRLQGTVVLPCSGGTLGALATGRADTLIQRAAAVALKEGWPLVLGVRETPLSLIHLENMRRLAYLGAVMLPPMPAFYVGGEDLDRFLDAYALRLLDCLGIESSMGDELRWRGSVPGESP